MHLPELLSCLKYCPAVEGIRACGQPNQHILIQDMLTTLLFFNLTLCLGQKWGQAPEQTGPRLASRIMLVSWSRGSICCWGGCWRRVGCSRPQGRECPTSAGATCNCPGSSTGV